MKLDDLTQKYVGSHPDDGAHILMKRRQVIWYILLFGLLFSCFIWRWDILLYAINFFFAFLYFSVILFRGSASLLSLLGKGITVVSPQTLDALTDADLPVYTILVPLYREANIASKIIARLDQLDYPKTKLDIKLLLEVDDDETQNALNQLQLPSHYDVIIVPDGQPRTKPRACNYGLDRAAGEFCVIYDAEDRPEADQLKKVVAAFRTADGDVACIQAKLNFYNASQNLLTRWFAIEYSTWFDLFLPGLQTVHVPIPLGGTSNHFRTAILKELGGWDPFNVTEDCDLGVRIYKARYRTRMVESTTWEEANCRLWNWVRQRSRWVKGFFQTHLAHTRHPLRTLRGLGLWGFFGFLMSVGGSSLMMVMNVFYWLIGIIYLGLLTHGMSKGHTAWEFICRRSSGSEGLPASIVMRGYEIRAWPLLYVGDKQDRLWSNLALVFFVIVCVLLAANLVFIGMHAVACIKRRRPGLLPFALLMPIYWVLISVGAWKGFLQLFTNPFYWEKTDHGLDDASH